MSKAVQPRYLNGDALREARAAAGLEQSELAERVEATQGQISGWERGHTGCRLGMLHKLADALGIEPAVLMRREAAESTVPQTNGAAA